MYSVFNLGIRMFVFPPSSAKLHLACIYDASIQVNDGKSEAQCQNVQRFEIISN